ARKESLTIGLDAKAARKAERQRQNEARFAARTGMLRGDERYFTARDRGPVRKAVRDFVDRRRTVGEFFVPMAFIVILSGMIRNENVRILMTNAWLIMLILLILDSAWLGYRVNVVMKREFPEKSERKGITLYAIMRGLQIRKFRIPPATVKAGGKPVTPKK
ncbi:MAG: DUF3043 domain-containing protein, partial [Actinobacteria bacterium]|nr:DUF3043 domain-containing protein [Actinomycetota bacterium]